MRPTLKYELTQAARDELERVVTESKAVRATADRLTSAAIFLGVCIIVGSVAAILVDVLRERNAP